MLLSHNVIHPCKPANHCRATLMTSLNTSFSTTDCVFTVSRRFQGMPRLPTSCQRGRAQRSAHPEHSRKRCWFPRTSRAEQSWLTRCCQRTGRNSWCKRSHWSPLETKGEKEWRMKKGRKSCLEYINWKLAIACALNCDVIRPDSALSKSVQTKKHNVDETKSFWVPESL